MNTKPQDPKPNVELKKMKKKKTTVSELLKYV
jgi:hypothetical protein